MTNNSSIVKGEGLGQEQRTVRLSYRLEMAHFETKAILNHINKVYQPFFDNPSSMKPGQILFAVVSVENPVKEKLSGCQMKTLIFTLDATDDALSVRERKGMIALCGHRLHRIAAEAFQQDDLLSIEAIVNRVLNGCERTLIRDIKTLKDAGICRSLRSTIKDIGRTISHREMIVKRWLSGIEFSDIARKANHGTGAIANCVEKFKRMICLAKDNHEIKTFAFPVKISVNIAQQYYGFSPRIGAFFSAEGSKNNFNFNTIRL